EENLLEMYSLKTAALIKAACVCGTILAGADETLQRSAEIYAEKLGIAFQIIDDILDFEGDERMLGKPIGSDDKNGKKTLVNILGIEKCKEMAQCLTNEAMECLDMFEGDTNNLRVITEYLLLRNY
ncbi:MAG: polyprenyl synthetase family protein, partial [Clostridia bacterium]|nr:polyprenyl synthetase family protein [Clostridia bacterium]